MPGMVGTQAAVNTTSVNGSMHLGRGQAMTDIHPEVESVVIIVPKGGGWRWPVPTPEIDVIWYLIPQQAPQLM